MKMKSGFLWMRRWGVAALLFATTVPVSGCDTAEQAAAEALVTPEQENMLGLQIKNELITKQGVKFLADKELESYIRGLANKVVDIGKSQPTTPAFTWEVNVIDDPAQVNAFATPGGYLYVYTGLLRAAENEAEVVGVMSHEVGHVLARHFARRLVRQYGIDALKTLLLGSNPGLLTTIATEVATQGALLSNSRENETEADDYGAAICANADYDPNGLITFFGKLQKINGTTPQLLKYLSTHPAPEDRIAHLMMFIKDNKLQGSMVNAEMFQKMRAKVPAPPATTMP